MLRQTRKANKWFGQLMSTDEEEYVGGRVMDRVATCRGEGRVDDQSGGDCVVLG